MILSSHSKTAAVQTTYTHTHTRTHTHTHYRRTHGALEVVCTPCQHFSGRFLHDRGQTLWASWALLGKQVRTLCLRDVVHVNKSVVCMQNRFYFAGDTGYRSVPKGYSHTRQRTCCLSYSYYLIPDTRDIGKSEEEIKKMNLPTCPAFKEIGEK